MQCKTAAAELVKLIGISLVIGADGARKPIGGIGRYSLV